MKAIFTIFVFFITVLTSYAQSRSLTDSLSDVLRRLPRFGYSFETDTLRLSLENKIIREDIFSISSDLALQRAKESLTRAHKINYLRGEGEAYLTLANVYSSRNEMLNTVETLYKALVIFEELADKRQVAFIYRSLGDNYQMMNNLEKALEFNKKAIDIFKSLSDQFQYAVTLNNLGLIYQDHGDYKASIKYFNDAVNHVREHRIDGLDVYIYPNLAKSYQGIEEYDRAMNYYNETLSASVNKREATYVTTFAQINLAYIYHLKAELPRALKHLNVAESVLKGTSGMDDLQMAFYETAWKIYRDRGDFKKSLVYFEKYNEFNTRSISQSSGRKIDALQLEYDNRVQENRILNLRKIIVLIVISVGVLLILGYFLIRNLRKLKERNKIIELQKEEIGKINGSLTALNSNLEIKVEERTVELSELNRELSLKNAAILEALVEGKKIERKRVSAELHDNLGSTLSAIRFRLQAIGRSSLSEEEIDIYDHSLKMLSSAYRDLRNISHHLLPENFEKNGLKLSLENYLAVINETGKITFTLGYQAIERFENSHIELEVYSICMELVNNVLKHSIGSSAEVKVWTVGGNIQISVSDNGSYPIDFQEGFGLKNIRKRITSFNGSMAVSAKETFQVFLSIPFS